MSIYSLRFAALFALATFLIGCPPASESSSCDTDSDCDGTSQCIDSVCEWDFDEDAGHDVDENENAPDVSGVIDGHDFELVTASIDLVQDEHYVVGVRNYEIGCDRVLDIPDEFTPLVVNFEIQDTEPGISDVYINSGHGASMQRGLDDSESFTVEDGTLTLHSWSTTTGDVVIGEIDFSAGDNDEHHLSGRFEAEVCF